MAKSKEEKEKERIEAEEVKKEEARVEAERLAEEAKKNGTDLGSQSNTGTASVNVPLQSDIVKPQVKEEMVSISREDFNRMMGQLEKQSNDINLLYKAADKSRLAKLQNTGENLIKQVRIRTYDTTGLMVIAWKLITNRCEVVMGKWIEDQTVNFVLENGEVVTCPLIEFYRKTLDKVEADVIGKKEEYDAVAKTNKLFFELQFPSGKKLTIDSVFVN